MPLYVDYTSGEVGCQEDFALEDGRRNWKERKLMSLDVAKLMRRYDPDRAGEIRRCGTYLSFVLTPDGGKKLRDANFCRQRLCPMCQWRRSLKLAVQADDIYRELTRLGYRHLFVTLTVRNCSGTDLNDTINFLYKRVSEFQRSTAFKRSFLGAYRAFEVTYNAKDDTYHPHFHMILTVSPAYFDEPTLYWSHVQLVKRWRNAAHLDYDPSVSIEVIRQKSGQSLTSACVEACKYPAKTAEIKKWEVLRTIDFALRGRRLVTWTGLPAQIRKDMQMDDIENGSLIHMSEDVAGEEELAKIVYVWRHGLYMPMDVCKIDGT